MKTTAENFFFRQRESTARTTALLVGAMLIVGKSQLVLFPMQNHHDEPIRIELKEIKPDLPKPQPKPVEKPRVLVKKAVIPVQKPVVKVPVPAVVPQVVSVPTPTRQVAPVANPAPPVQQPRIVSNGESEAGFARSVRQKIESHKIYPGEAQSLGITGSVTLLYVIDRSGKLLRVEITSSSGSKVLDQAALRAVRATTFQPMPEDAWVGEAHKEFKTKIDFELDD